MKVFIRKAKPQEHLLVGELMVTVYSQLDGFPSPKEQPKYYDKLRNIGQKTQVEGNQLLVAVDEADQVLGAVWYIGDVKNYESGGSVTSEINSAGFRLLAVDPKVRGLGIGKNLSQACIDIAKKESKDQLIIHSTEAMKTAWKMYEQMGFKRSADLDFLQKGFPVFGFRLPL